MMPLTTFLHDFQGAPLLTVTWDGRPAWVARHIASRIGYSHDGKKLPNKILGDWSDEFIAGHDYVLLKGAELAAFKKGLAGVEGIPGRGSLLLLFLPGVFLALAKTELTLGKKLRRFLVDEVLPAIAQTGRFSMADDDEPPPVSPALSLPERREERLLYQAHVRASWVTLCSRRLKVATLHRMVEVLGDRIDPDLRRAFEVLAAQIATGLPLLDLLGDDDRLADVASRLAA